MSINNKVVWSEGLFLQPQHLQQQERYLESLVTQRPSNTGLQGYGITHIEIDHHLLELGKLAIIKCKGIFPDGTAFNIPAEDQAPTPIDISSGLTNIKIYLALPLKRPGAAEVTHQQTQKLSYRYFTEEREISDNNMDANVSTRLQVGCLSLRLMLETDDRGGYTCLPLVNIKESLADKLVKLDEQFIAPCLNAKAIQRLDNFTQELLGLLHHRGEALILHMTDTGYGGASEVADFMLLQLINRTEPLFEFFVSKKTIHPEILYIYLLQLMGELSTFTNKTRRVIRTRPYDHDDLQSCFDPVIKELRQSLSAVLQHSAIALSLETRNHGIWVSPISDRELLKEASFVLAVSADIAPEELRVQFPAQVKVSSVEMINSLISRALPGIELLPLGVVPRQIPFHSGFTYYSLNKRHKYWEELQHSGGIAIHIGNEFPNLALQLWAILENN